MTKKEIKRKAYAFLKEHALLQVDYMSLREAIECRGYTVIEYNHIFNDEDVQALIDVLQLSDGVLRSRGFTYADRNYRLVFVHEDLSVSEKGMVLAHEAGHIYLSHLNAAPIIGQDTQEEYAANEFAHFIASKPPLTIVQIYMTKHKKLTSVIILILVLAIIVSAIAVYVRQEQQYYGEYYVTTTGDKYHETECIFVKDKTTARRLTVEEFEGGEYERCHICLP